MQVRTGPALVKLNWNAKRFTKCYKTKVAESATMERAFPVVFDRKKDGSLCFCVDQRRLHAMTVSDSYSTPKMDECID